MNHLVMSIDFSNATEKHCFLLNTLKRTLALEKRCLTLVEKTA